jgi:hypothetical protein
MGAWVANSAVVFAILRETAESVKEVVAGDTEDVGVVDDLDSGCTGKDDWAEWGDAVRMNRGWLRRQEDEQARFVLPNRPDCQSAVSNNVVLPDKTGSRPRLIEYLNELDMGADEVGGNAGGSLLAISRPTNSSRYWIRFS